MQDAPSLFTKQLWTAITPIFEAILQHPFVTGLSDGKLSRDRFSFYIVQDALYLKTFARALSALAASAPDSETTGLFNRHASDALAVERSLHEEFLADLGLHPEQLDTVEASPSNLAYGNFLMASTLGRSFQEGLAAVLPCYWIYQRVGQKLLPGGSPDPLYKRWLDTYGGDEYDVIVQEVLDLTNRVAQERSSAEKDAMRERFVIGSRYEWMFWDSAYRLERWPV